MRLNRSWQLTRRGFLAGSGRAAAGLAGLSLAGPLASAAQAAAKTRLTVWWWGEQEASGLQAWMQETAAQFEAAHPGVEVATVLQATESLYPSFTAAGEARQGPDVQYMWGGLSTMQFASAGDQALLETGRWSFQAAAADQVYLASGILAQRSAQAQPQSPGGAGTKGVPGQL